jgi:hypothetical protein
MAVTKQVMKHARQVNTDGRMVSSSSCQHIDVTVNILIACLNTATVKRQIVLNTHHLFYLLKVWESFRSLISTYYTIGYQARRDESATQCHPERSEGSCVMGNEILRFAQDDKRVLSRSG